MIIKKRVYVKVRYYQRSPSNKWYGINEQSHTLVEVFKNHNEQLESLIDISNSKATYGKYRTTLDHTVAFLNWKFKRSDIEITNITYSFIPGYRRIRRINKQCSAIV